MGCHCSTGHKFCTGQKLGRSCRSDPLKNITVNDTTNLVSFQPIKYMLLLHMNVKLDYFYKKELMRVVIINFYISI